MLTNSDTDLVLRLLADDVDAFDALYRRYHGAIHANILKLTRDAEAAQDILQEVFIVLWEKRQTIDVAQPVSNWLFSISYYQSLKYLKKALKKEVILKNIESESLVENDVESRWSEDTIDAMQSAIQQLSPQKQKVLVRCKLAGKSYKEVAEELNISHHTVKEYLALAMTSLRTILKICILFFLFR